MYREELPLKNLLIGRDFIKPYYYDVEEYKNGIRHSYWVHTEYNYDPDIQDYKVNITEAERTLFTRCVLGISQIEVKVKDFWIKAKDIFPHYEILIASSFFFFFLLFFFFFKQKTAYEM